MLTNNIEYIFKDIEKQTGLKLSFEKQFAVNSNFERQQKCLCHDFSTSKKYMLMLAYTPAQIIRIEHTIVNIKKAQELFSDFFQFNLPIAYKVSDECCYILYEYFESATKNREHNLKLNAAFKYVEKNFSYKLKINKENIQKIMDNLVLERCPADLVTIEKFKATKEYGEYKTLLENYDHILMCPIIGDAKNDNILLYNNTQYIIGFEYGGVDLPIGFDRYCQRRMEGNKNCDDLPYHELHECLYKIHHINPKATWISAHNPKVKISKNNNFIKIKEYDKISTIPIKKLLNISNYHLIIDFKEQKISPYAMKKLVDLINKKFNSRYTIHVKNSPYWFKRLKQSDNSKLLFSGVINKDCEEPKTLIEWFKSSQAYINYSRILPYVKPYWFRALLAVLICIPIGSLDAVIALSLKPYMDLVMVEKTVSSPWYIPFGIVAFTIIQGLLNYTATYLNTWVGGKITNDLKFTLYKKMLTLETSYFDKKKSGDIVFRFNNDADSACSGLLDNLKTFVSRLFSSLSLIGVLFYNSWQLALIAVVVLGCAFLPIASIQKRIKSVIDKSVSVTSAAISSYNESYAGNKTITSYNLKKKQELKFKDVLNNIFNLKIKLVQRTSWLSPMMHVIVSIGIGLAIGYGSHLILANKITSGNFVSFITALIMLYTPIKNLGNNFNAVQFSFLAIERVFSILNLEPKIKDCEGAIELKNINNQIEFKNINFEYVKNRPVLKNINLSINKGQTIAFVGNSGGGKSTIVSLLPRFYDINSGSISIDGIDIREYSLESLRQNIAVVFQDNFLFSGTIKENILLGNEKATTEDLEKAVKMAYLEDFIEGLKDGIDTQVGERGVLLSGGQKQRVAIARAFLKDAPIIILDEATSALDNKAEAIVQKAIDNLMQDKTVFVIAHRLSTIKNADRIAVINEGELVELGTHEDLMNIKNGQYKALYEMQFKKQEVKN